MHVSVILCTYNRCRLLPTALNSLALSRVPAELAWEVLVVDNHSPDGTREVVEQSCRQHPGRIRYLLEVQPGKSHALNTGIREARGRILAFVDDDVRVEPVWLANLTAPLCDGPWVGTGGRILPEETFRAPAWLPVKERYALAPLALFDLGSEAGPLSEPPFGTNMAFQKRMFEEYDGFRTDLGPRPGIEMRNEDTEFGGRLLAAGERLRYQPSAVVYHGVPASRLRQEYFLAWWWAKARADIRQYGCPARPRPFARRVPLCLVRRLARWTLCWLITTEPSRRFSHKIKVWTQLGALAESWQGRRSDEFREFSAKA
jgi:glycosyltransferase involved in cell wall biosynthesis